MMAFEECTLMTVFYTGLEPNLRKMPLDTVTSKGTFQITNGLLYHYGKVCTPEFPEVQKRILFGMQCSTLNSGILEYITLVLISTYFVYPISHPRLRGLLSNMSCQHDSRLLATSILYTLDQNIGYVQSDGYNVLKGSVTNEF